ncbi:MAG: MATE family efflux transporter [Christensenellaceae bacterium]|nr:MATE family efflux transporter [Christensenellaceae bacterium]
MKNKYEMDMCSGRIFPKMLRFTLPLLATAILQLLYNAADMVVVGKFAGSTALAAVGSTASLIALFVNLFINISVGVGVAVALHYGATEEKAVSETLHTAVVFSLSAGVVIGIIGFFAARSMLQLMDTPADVIDQAVLYVKIYFLAAPANLLYNFGAAALRSVGDTRRPLLYLTVSGLANDVLNLFFVICFGMQAEGVALATAISQVLSAVLVVRCLLKNEGCCRLQIGELRIHRGRLREIIRIGLPAGLQSAVFSISNVLIQSGVNSFGSIVMAGNSISNNLENFVYSGMNSVTQASMSFVGQNVGGRKYERISKITVTGLAMVLTVGAVIGSIMFFFGEPLLGLYSSDALVVDKGMLRLRQMVFGYLLAGMMELFAFETRGMGQSVIPMICTIFGVCVLRVAWVYTVFQAFHTLEVLYLAYPITWGITVLLQFFFYRRTKRKLTIARIS